MAGNSARVNKLNHCFQVTSFWMPERRKVFKKRRHFPAIRCEVFRAAIRARRVLLQNSLGTKTTRHTLAKPVISAAKRPLVTHGFPIREQIIGPI